MQNQNKETEMKMQGPKEMDTCTCWKDNNSEYLPNTALCPKWHPWEHPISAPVDSHVFQIYDIQHWSQLNGKLLLMEKCIWVWRIGCADSQIEEHRAIPANSMIMEWEFKRGKMAVIRRKLSNDKVHTLPISFTIWNQILIFIFLD